MKRILGLTVLSIMLSMSALQAQADSTKFVSQAVDGSVGNSHSGDAVAISLYGRYIVFHSEASNLVANDTNGQRDVFIKDLETGEIEIISVDSDEIQANDKPFQGSSGVSAEGRFVVFSSFASNLVSGDTNGKMDVFLRDRELGVTKMISVAEDGSPGDGHSYYPSISMDGRYIAFYSGADNLGGLGLNRYAYVYDRVTDSMELIPSSSGCRPPVISGDGRYVAFSTRAAIASGDTNYKEDIYVYDRETGEFERASVATDGTEANSHSYSPSISADGRIVAWDSSATTLAPGALGGGYQMIYAHDRETGETKLISQTTENSYSYYPHVSGDGRFIAYRSDASDLVEGDTNGEKDVFVYDRKYGTTVLASIAPDGSQDSGGWAGAFGGPNGIQISAKGHFVTFLTDNLLPGKPSGKVDVYVRELCVCP